MPERSLGDARVAPTAVKVPILPAVPLLGAAGDELHELRVRIPVDLHRQLLSLKILRGRSLADTVALALDSYFAERQAAGVQDDEDDGR